jgi:flagellar biosynthetic protein FlhB
MAEASGGEKSLPASPMRRQRAREDGNVPRSQDLTAGASLLLALLALYMVGPMMTNGLLNVFARYFGQAHTLLTTENNAQAIALEAIVHTAWCALPFMGLMMLAGVTMNVAQIGFLLTTKPLMPKLDRINPITGMGKFFTLRSLVELVKSLLKLTLAIWVVWLTMRYRIDEFAGLMQATPKGLVFVTASMLVAVWWRLGLAMLIIGVMDYGFQRWHYERDLMMTMQEAKEEAKEFEGDPRIKARIRQIQRQMAMKRMMAAIPTADVVVTNPTHYAVALRYDLASMQAPTVIAKGSRLLALRIREIAMQSDVPIVEKPELARALHKSVEVGQAIPEDLFRTVAEVLAFVYQIDRREEKLRERANVGFAAAS